MTILFAVLKWAQPVKLCQNTHFSRLGGDILQVSNASTLLPKHTTSENVMRSSNLLYFHIYRTWISYLFAVLRDNFHSKPVR